MNDNSLFPNNDTDVSPIPSTEDYPTQSLPDLSEIQEVIEAVESTPSASPVEEPSSETLSQNTETLSDLSTTPSTEEGSTPILEPAPSREAIAQQESTPQQEPIPPEVRARQPYHNGYGQPSAPYGQRVPYAPNGQNPGQRAPGYGVPPTQIPNRAPYGNGYAPNPNGYAPNGNGYAPNPNGYAPNPNGYAPNPNGTPYGAPGYPYGANPTGNVPPSQFPPSGNFYASSPKEKKPRNWLLILLIAGCILIGTLCGILIGNMTRPSPEDLVPSENPSIGEGLPPAQSGRPSPTEASTNPPRETQPLATASGEQLTLNQIYNQNVPAIVGISTITTQNTYGQTSAASSTGSGFIISSDGEILTNYHVVEGAQQLFVSLYDGREYPATLIGYEAESDVALIKIEAENLPVCAIGNSDQVYVGEQIAAIGNPMGELTYTMTVGYVSAVDRFVTTDGNPISMIQVDAAINPGNSGGPVFNTYGEVIGIATAKYSGTLSGGATLEGLGFAIPINDIVEILNDLRINGKVPDRAYMGVMVSMLAVDEATYGIDHGVYVESVESDGSAYKAGVQAGDIILKIGDVETNAYENLQQTLRKYRAGDETTITLYRKGQTITLPIVFDAKPDTAQTTPTEPQYTEPVEPTDPGTSEEDPWSTFPWEDFPWGDFGG